MEKKFRYEVCAPDLFGGEVRIDGDRITVTIGDAEVISARYSDSGRFRSEQVDIEVSQSDTAVLYFHPAPGQEPDDEALCELPAGDEGFEGMEACDMARLFVPRDGMPSGNRMWGQVVPVV